MKKRLEAELISLAHRVLKLKNKSEVDQLYLESKKLYETLTILKFYGDNFDQVKATLSEKELEEKLAISMEEDVVEVKSIPIVEVSGPIIEIEEEKVEIPEIETKVVIETDVDEENVEIPEIETKVAIETVVDEENAEITEVVAEVEEEIIEVPEVDIKEEIVSEVIEEEIVVEAEPEVIKAEVSAPKPDFELLFDSKINEDKKPKAKTSEIIFDDFLGPNYADPVFIKPEDLAIEKEIEKKEQEKMEKKATTPSDKNSKGITIGLNDRVAFMKHLFANSSEDYNRVLSQLMTFNSYQEAQTFIADMVKPDYNDWKGKEDYEARFMEIVEKKFS
jgi:hypothetical protein